MSRRPLNILFIADANTTGGATDCLIELVREFSERFGFNCIVLTTSKDDLANKLDLVGIRNIAIGHYPFMESRPEMAYRRLPKYVSTYFRYFITRNRALKRAEDSINFDEIDIIHTNLPRDDLGIELAKRHDIPHVTHLREFSFEHFRCWSFRRDPVGYLSNGSSALIAVSAACRDAWVKRGVDECKISVVYDGVKGVEGSLFGPHAASLGSQQLRIVFLGGYNAPKGIEDAVGSLCLLPQELKKRVSMDVYGGGDARLRRRLESRLLKCGMHDSVRFLGEVGNIPELLPKYDLGLVCSRSEAFGRVVVEFAASGLAVLGANTGSMPELLLPDNIGILYDKSSGAEDLSKKVQFLMKHPEELATLQSNGPRVAKKYSIRRNAEEVKWIYDRVLDARIREASESGCNQSI